MFEMAPDFDEPLEDFKEYMYLNFIDYFGSYIIGQPIGISSPGPV
jgi:hypothetical protein